MCSISTCSSPNDITDVTRESYPDSHSVGYTLLNTSETFRKMIYNLLVHKDKRVTVIENMKKHTSNCWKNFGFPAIIDDKGVVLKTLDTFVACKYCFITFSYNNNSTSLMNKHDCENSPVRFSKESNTTSSSSMKQKILIFHW